MNRLTSFIFVIASILVAIGLSNAITLPPGVTAYQSINALMDGNYQLQLSGYPGNFLLGNILAFNGLSGATIPMWVESNNIAWIYPNSTFGSTNGIIYLGYGNSGTNFFVSGNNLGEAPQLESVSACSSYGECDNGNSVFPLLYQNFKGTSTPSGWTGGCTVNNSVTVTGCYIITSSGWASGNVVDTLADIPAPTSAENAGVGYIGYEGGFGQPIAWWLNTGLGGSCASASCGYAGGQSSSAITQISTTGKNVYSVYWTGFNNYEGQSGTFSGTFSYNYGTANTVSGTGESPYTTNNIGAWNNQGSQATITITWIRERTPPPDDVMPGITYGPIINTSDHTNVCPISPNWIKNFYNRICFYNLTNTGLFNNVNIGSVNYVYLNLSNVLLNGTPVYKGTHFYILQGYVGSNFVGNVSAYPYNKGLLVSLYTVLGRTYNSLILYFNQSNVQNTYYYQNYSMYNPSCAPLKNAVCGEQYLTLYLSQVPFYVYLTPSFKEAGSVILNPGSLNETYTYTFNPTQNYFLFQSGAYKPFWFNLTYWDPVGNLYTLNDRSVAGNYFETLSNVGFLGFSLLSYKVTNVTKNIVGAAIEPSRLYVNSTQIGTNVLYNNYLNYPYFLLSYGLGAYSANYFVFNKTTQGAGFAGLSIHQNLAIVNVTADNVTYENSTFMLIPAYSTSYSNSLIQTNSSPSQNQRYLNASCNVLGWWCYNYREEVIVNNWNYTFNSNADVSSLGLPNSFVSNNAPYLKLTITRYSEMGIGCNDMFFDAYNASTNTDYGIINYSVVSCNSNSPNATFILNGTTAKGISNYDNFFVYWDNINLINSTLSSKTLHEWVFDSGNVFTTPLANYELDLNAPISIGSFFGLVSFVDCCTANLGIQYSYPYIKSYGKGSPLPDTNIGNYTNSEVSYLVYGTQNAILGHNLAGIDSYLGDNLGIANTVTVNSGFPTLPEGYVQINLTAGYKASAVNFYASTYNVSPIIQGFQYNFSRNRTYVTPNTIVTITGNSSLIIGLSNQSIFGNVTKYLEGNNQSVTYFGITAPKYSWVILAIIVIVLLGLTFAIDNEYVVFGIMIMSWIVGIFSFVLAPGYGSAALIVVCLFYLLYYILIRSKKWKHGKR